MVRRYTRKGRGPGQFSSTNQPEVIFCYGSYRSKSFNVGQWRRRREAPPRTANEQLANLLVYGKLKKPKLRHKSHKVRRILDDHIETRRCYVVQAFTELQAAFAKMIRPRIHYAMRRAKNARVPTRTSISADPTPRHVALFMQECMKPASKQSKKEDVYVPIESVKSVQRVIAQELKAGTIKSKKRRTSAKRNPARSAAAGKKKNLRKNRH